MGAGRDWAKWGQDEWARQARDRRGRGRPPRRDGRDTRAEILDAALDLFSEKGYDQTSLREIAEQVRITKAALYYYFPSKEALFATLAGRVFDAADTAFTAFERKGFSMDGWRDALAGVVERLLSERKVVTLLERNRAAFERMEDKLNDLESHRHFHEFADSVVADRSLPLEERVRFACSVGAVMGVILSMGDGFADVTSEELTPLVLDAMRDILRVRE